MKECRYCGTQYADELLSCPNCGANVVVSEKDRIIEDAYKEKEIADVKGQIEAQKKVEKPKMAPGKKLLIAMCSIAAVLIIVIIVTSIVNNAPVTADGRTNDDLEDEYISAVESMELGHYEEAIAEFDRIPAEYKDYDKVTEQRKKAVDAYREQVLEQADVYISVGKHNDALSVLVATINTYGETKELVQKKDEILYDYKQGVFSEAESYSETGDYSTAIKRLQMLLDVLKTDADTEMKIQYYSKAQVLKQVQIYENENNYESAITYLQDKIEELGADAELATKLTSMFSAYKAVCAEKAKTFAAEKDYESAIAVLENLINLVGSDEDVSVLIYAYEEAQVLEKVQECIVEKEYLSGINYLKALIQEVGERSTLSFKLEELTSLYKSDVMNRAEEDAKKGKYAGAVASLRSLSGTIGSSTEIEAKILEYRKKEIGIELDGYDKSKDYAGAITYLQGTSEAKSDEELKAKLESYIGKHKKELFAKAESAYKETGYSAAVQVLNSDKLLKNDAEIKEKVAFYNRKKPVLLSELEEYEGDIAFYSGEVTDVAGNIYHGYFSDREEVTYYLKGMYERFMCKLVMLDANGECDRSLALKNADSGEVLFSYKLQQRDAEGIYVDIDVSDVDFLVIELRTTTGTWSTYKKAAMADAQLIRK